MLNLQGVVFILVVLPACGAGLSPGFKGFMVHEAEWWHVDYKDWQNYPIMNVRFNRIANN